MPQKFSQNTKSQDVLAQALKVPPHSIDAEQSVLGGLMVANEVLEDLLAIVNKTDFYTQQHQEIFSAIFQLHTENKPFDLITVIERLETIRQLETAGGKDYLAQLVANTPGGSNILFYAQIVRDKSILRKLITTSNEITEIGYFPQGKDIREVLDLAEQKILAIAEHGEGKERHYHVIGDLLSGAMTKLEELSKQDGNITGLATHLTDFDEKTSGLQKSDLIIVAGRPAMGKTTFAMNIAENAAIKSGAAVAVFSMEMPAEQLTMRMISSVGRISAGKMRTGSLENDDWRKLTMSISKLADAKIYIDDSPALSITELRARARRIDKDVRTAQIREALARGDENPEESATGLDLLVIDYLQLMRGSQHTDNRVNEISEISRGLKSLAMELDIPVIALSQLNRSLENRHDRRPIMADLRESGAIEQDADIIVFIYRDEVYHPDSEDKGTAEIIIGKYRSGEPGMIRMTFIGEYTKFADFTPVNSYDAGAY